MADYTQRDETKTRRIYSLPSPTNWAEVAKVLNALRQDADLKSDYDDAVTVEAWDDEIRFSFEVKGKK
jgi:hypothetical protein